MSFESLAEWLANTPGSIAIHESPWGYPLLESAHVWTMCLFLGMIILLDLRLVGLTMRRVPVSEVAGRLLPWARAGFVVMVITGVLLFYAIPIRTFHSIWFRYKVVALILAGLNAWVFHWGAFRTVAEWDLDSVLPKRARMAGIVSLALWASIVVAGRLIAYNWFDCDKPQPSIVNVLAGCSGDSQQ